jgi:hypothetical protein
MKHILVLLSALAVMVVGVTNAQASTVCFASKELARNAYPSGQKVFYTTIKTTGNDHVDMLNKGPIGSKCWHVHSKLPVMDHLPRANENYLTLEYMYRFWPVPTYVPLK